MNIRRRVLFSGRVQGVGFRYTTQRIAGRYPVVGFVKNLPDGRVELIVEAKNDQINAFLTELTQQLSANISDQDVEESSATDEFSSFDIRF